MKSSQSSSPSLSRLTIVLSLTLLIVLNSSDSSSAFAFEWPSFMFFKKSAVVQTTTQPPVTRSVSYDGPYGPLLYGPAYELPQALISPEKVDDREDWCSQETSDALSPKCSCRGPGKFPIISCSNITGQQSLNAILNTRSPVKSFGRLLVYNSSIPNVDEYSLIADKEFAVISLMKTETKTFDLDSIQASRLSLVRLEITHNLLTSFPFSNLTKFKFLSHLDLRYNNFKTIIDDAFGHNDQLRSIDFSHNEISHVGSNAFHSLPMLDQLDLSFNRLKIINNYAFASKSPASRSLTLDLSNNKVFFFANGSFSGQSFKELILDNNKLNKFPEKHFKPLLKAMVMQEKSVISVQSTKKS